MKKTIIIVRLCFAVIVGIIPGRVDAAQGAPFSGLFVFGDSLSDTGNFFALNGGVQPPAPYFGGRFCNGPVWIEYLAQDLGIVFAKEDNYAVGGALTGSNNFNDGFLGLEYPGLQEEISSFLATHSTGADPKALYIVWAGPNDFFSVLGAGGSPEELIANGVGNTLHALQVLWNAGARHILLPNIPDIGITPEALASGAGPSITQLCIAYNQVLATGLDSLEKSGIRVVRIDAFSVLQEMVYDPGRFEFENVSEPLLGALMAGGTPDPDAYVFWDAAHPTTRAHEVLARETLKQVLDCYSPAHRMSDFPLSYVHALNGLIRAPARR
jgi:phospholipase/lecithinase/hemolysin